MAVKRLVRSPLTWVLALIVAVGLGIGMAYFQPWRLFTSTTVDEAAPTVSAPVTPGAAPVEPQILARGALISHEHDTSGTVVVLGLPDGSRVLRLENLDTSDGPDLHVWLSDAPVLSGRDGWGVFDDGAYHDLGKLRGNKGNQNYPIPAEIDLTQLTSVSIWCDRFNVSFGAAVLQQA
ncbi:DM13 domain-containing protein [Nocardia cyriacigeorgica]|uniref:DM13 domain-containing protein n=1 Tax=Nocardia cyriacigeorgica TaxID=135487 RepID=UPI001894146D|nr:DM13 domain-containing protein [Nocardia cyriacigeorgica]MBF6287089.1 DM13 domain-containing protein [Nocardia cyriacigeorgica]